MLKLILSLTLLLSLDSALAKKCAVYGISDSPQSLICAFDKIREIRLSCLNGNYYMNSSKVSVAFHYEVETGPVPLVFKSREGMLTVLHYSNRNIKAVLTNKHYEYSGKCRIK